MTQKMTPDANIEIYLSCSFDIAVFSTQLKSPFSRNYEAEKDDLLQARSTLEKEVETLKTELTATKAKSTNDAESVGQEVANMSAIIERLTQEKLQQDQG